MVLSLEVQWLRVYYAGVSGLGLGLQGPRA